jgi:hypothetical protein
MRIPAMPPALISVDLVKAMSAAIALTGVTAAVYRLGILREQMSSTERTVTMELARSRDDMTRNFDALERRADRCQARVETRLDTIDRRLTLLENDRTTDRAAHAITHPS